MNPIIPTAAWSLALASALATAFDTPQEPLQPDLRHGATLSQDLASVGDEVKALVRQLQRPAISRRVRLPGGGTRMIAVPQELDWEGAVSRLEEVATLMDDRPSLLISNGMNWTRGTLVDELYTARYFRRLLASDSSTLPQRAVAYASLGQLTEPALYLKGDVLNRWRQDVALSRDGDERLHLTTAFRGVDVSDDDLPFFERLLTDSRDFRVRREVISVLERRREHESVREFLSEVVRTDHSNAVRRQAQDVLNRNS